MVRQGNSEGMPPDAGGWSDGQHALVSHDRPDPELAAWVFRIGMAIGLVVVAILVRRAIQLLWSCLASIAVGS